MRISTVADLGNYVREQRHTSNLTQASLATRAAVSRRWLADLEAGKPTVELGLALRVLAALGQFADVRPDPATDFDLDDYLEHFGGDDA